MTFLLLFRIDILLILLFRLKLAPSEPLPFGKGDQGDLWITTSCDSYYMTDTKCVTSPLIRETEVLLHKRSAVSFQLSARPQKTIAFWIQKLMADG